MIARLQESPFYNSAFHTSHHDNELPNRVNVSYIVWMSKLMLCRNRVTVHRNAENEHN